MTETTDGFQIAEADMKLRGPGDIDGTLQSGLPFNLKVASLAHDGEILSMARKYAADTLDKYPQLSIENFPSENNTNYNDKNLATITYEINRRFGKTFNWANIS